MSQRYNIRSRKPARSVMRLILASSVPRLDIPNHDKTHRFKARRFQTSRQTESETLSINHPRNNRAVSENRRTCKLRPETEKRHLGIDATKRQRNGVTSSSKGETCAILPFLSGGAGQMRLSCSIPYLRSSPLSPSSSSPLRLAIFPLRPSVSLHLSRFYDALSRGRRSGMR